MPPICGTEKADDKEAEQIGKYIWQALVAWMGARGRSNLLQKDQKQAVNNKV